MGLYKLYSSNVEIQYKSYFLSKAMFFTIVTSLLSIILPFILAYRSRGFWLKSHYFYEQPSIRFTYQYIFVAETEDPSLSIFCGDLASDAVDLNTENCAEFQVQEYDYNGDSKNDIIEFKLGLNVPPDRSVTSITLIAGLDFQLKETCPLHMQTVAVINQMFPTPASGMKLYGDIEFHQITHLPCLRNIINTQYNTSLFSYEKSNPTNIIDFILNIFFSREVTTEVKVRNARNYNGNTGNMQIGVQLRVPESKIRYIPSLLQELKWAWPQYLSLVVVFHWIFNKIKRFVFNNRLLMAWEVIPWKRVIQD